MRQLSRSHLFLCVCVCLVRDTRGSKKRGRDPGDPVGEEIINQLGAGQNCRGADTHTHTRSHARTVTSPLLAHLGSIEPEKTEKISTFPSVALTLTLTLFLISLLLQTSSHTHTHTLQGLLSRLSASTCRVTGHAFPLSSSSSLFSFSSSSSLSR